MATFLSLGACANASSRHFITAENAHARYIRLRGGKRPFVSRGSPVP